MWSASEFAYLTFSIRKQANHSVSNGHWFNFSGSRCFSELGNYSNLKRTLVVAAVEAVFNVVWLLAGDLMHFHMTPSRTKADCFLLFFCYTNEFLLKQFLFLQILEIDTRSSFSFAVSFTICCRIMLVQKAALGYQPKKAETSVEASSSWGMSFSFSFMENFNVDFHFFTIARQSLFLFSNLFDLHICIFSVQ